MGLLELRHLPPELKARVVSGAIDIAGLTLCENEERLVRRVREELYRELSEADARKLVRAAISVLALLAGDAEALVHAQKAGAAP